MTPRGRLNGERGLVYEALRFLDLATVETLTLYTGLSNVAIRAILRQERYDWCDIVDQEIHRGRNRTESGVWQYQGPETTP